MLNIIVLPNYLSSWGRLVLAHCIKHYSSHISQASSALVSSPPYNSTMAARQYPVTSLDRPQPPNTYPLSIKLSLFAVSLATKTLLVTTPAFG